MKNTKQHNQIRITRAHTQMRGTKQYVGQINGAINFLRKKKYPYDYDVDMSSWNGINWEISFSVSGDEFLKDPKQFSK